MSSNRSSLDDIAPSTRAAAASDRLLKTPIATSESRVSTTRLVIRATTGISRPSSSNPSAEMFFSTRSRREVRLGFSSSVTMINLFRIVHYLFIRLRIAYLPYITSESLYQSGHLQIVTPSSNARKYMHATKGIANLCTTSLTRSNSRTAVHLTNWSFGVVLAIFLSISSSGLLSPDSFEMDDLASRTNPTLE